jgi:hypothetical protein
MTGNVPYYGGRLTPAQANAAGHIQSTETPIRPASAQRPAAGARPEEIMASLEQLREGGLVTDEEFAELAARVLS